jgi:uncharacterized membrane protein
MSSQWYCHLQDVSHGPLTTETVVEMIRRGQVVQDTPLCQIPEDEWHPACSFSLFEGYFDAPAPHAEDGYNELGTYLAGRIDARSNRAVAAQAKKRRKGKWGNILVFVLLVGIIMGVCHTVSGMHIRRSPEARSAMRQYEKLRSQGHTPTLRMRLPLLRLQTEWWIVVSAITSALTLSQAIYFLNIARGAPVDLSLLLRGYRYWLKSFILQMTMTVFVLLWSLLLIVPGIKAALAYSQAWYILAENPEMSCLEILRQSRQRMLGKKAQLFFLGFRVLPFSLLLITAMICISNMTGRSHPNASWLANTILNAIGGHVILAYWYPLTAVFYTALPRAKTAVK